MAILKNLGIMAIGKSFLCFLAVSATVWCTVFTAYAGQNDCITVSGRVINIPDNGSKTIIINECDISEKSERRVSDLDDNGVFSERIPFSFGHTFTVNYNRRLFVNAYAEPGDSIFVEIDASKSPMTFRLDGSHAKLNEEYAHAVHALSPIYYDVTLPPDNTPLAEYMAGFKKEFNRARAKVDDYIASNSISEEAARMLQLDNLFTIANQAIGFTGSDESEQVAFFTDTIFDIFNKENVKVMIFPYHLSALCNRFPEYIDSVPNSIIRDLMYASLSDAPIPERSKFFNTDYYDRIYGTSSTNTIDIDRILPSKMTVLENGRIHNIDDANPIEWLTRKYHDKVIYVDISATWCGPCRAALTGSNGVRAHFKDSGAVFAVIWLKSDFAAWSRLAPSINDAVHIFIPDEDMSNRIMGALGVAAFPSYYLIDRNGALSGDKIPRINNPELPDFLKSKL